MDSAQLSRANGIECIKGPALGSWGRQDWNWQVLQMQSNLTALDGVGRIGSLTMVNTSHLNVIFPLIRWLAPL